MIKSRNIMFDNIDNLREKIQCIELNQPNKALVQVFCGEMDVELIQSIIDTFKQHLPGTPLIGATTAGEIIDGRSMDNSIVINITQFEETTVKSVLITNNDDLYAVGSQIVDRVKTDNTKSLIVLGCGLKNGHTINATEMMKSIHENLPDATVSGAQAGDNGNSEITYVFSESGITSSGVAAASLNSDVLNIVRTYNLSWVPIGKKMTITKAEGSKVYEIDNMSPYEVYKHYLGDEVVDGLPLSAADFPLIIDRDGMRQAIHATGVNEDGSFNFIHNFRVGEQMQFGYCHAGLLALSANKTYNVLNKQALDVAFVYTCVSRKWVLGEDIDVELNPITEINCSAGFFSYGEYYQIETGSNLFLGQTLTILALSEKEELTNASPVKNKYGSSESHQFRTMRVLHRLVEKSTSEIESMNTELASLVHIDKLTGLGNRRRFDQKFKKAIESSVIKKQQLSIIIFDIDNFKKYNDTYGHVEGDNCLRGIGQVVKQLVTGYEDVAARYGGEEFAIILPNTDNQGAMIVAERIRFGIENLRIEHSTSQTAKVVTSSFGVTTYLLKEVIDPNLLIKSCDTLLYEAKSTGRNKCIGKNVL